MAKEIFPMPEGHKGSPQSVFIAISYPDDSVAIMQFITLVRRNVEDAGYVREPTPENINAELAKAGYGGLPWEIIDQTAIPEDRLHRAAWKLADKMIVKDPVKVKEINDANALAAAIKAVKAEQDAAIVEQAKTRLK